MQVNLDFGQFEIQDYAQCNWDRDAAIEYLERESDLIVYHNQASFQQEEYGKDRVLKQSVITKLRSNF